MSSELLDHLLKPRVADIDQPAMRLLKQIKDCLSYSSLIVAVSHTEYTVGLGGVQKLISEEQGQFHLVGASYMHLSPLPVDRRDFVDRDWDQRLAVYVDSVRLGEFSLSKVAVALRALRNIAGMRLLGLHMHHLLGWSAIGVALLRAAAEPEVTRFFLHDYYSVCRQFNLISTTGRICVDNPERTPQCDQCYLQDDRPKHFQKFKRFLQDSSIEIVAPSDSAAFLWKNAYPEFGDRVRIIPHQVMSGRSADRSERLLNLSRDRYRLKVAYIGATATTKGWKIWTKLLGEKTLSTRYEFHLFGNGSSWLPPNVFRHTVDFRQNGPNAMIEALEGHLIDMAFLWSVSPETYSYTAFESAAAGAFIITNPMSGNIAALAQAGYGRVFPDEESLAAFLAEDQAVRAAISGSLRLNPPIRLSPNPQIARETVAERPVTVPSKDEGDMQVASNPHLYWLYAVVSDTDEVLAEAGEDPAGDCRSSLLGAHDDSVHRFKRICRRSLVRIELSTPQVAALLRSFIRIARQASYGLTKLRRLSKRAA